MEELAKGKRAKENEVGQEDAKETHDATTNARSRCLASN